MYLKAIREEYLFPTVNGNVNVVELAKMPLEKNVKHYDLNEVAKTLYKSIREENELNFVSDSPADELVKCKLNIVLDLIRIKKEELEALNNKKANKVHNDNILAIMKDNNEAKLRTMSNEELAKLLK